MVECHAAFFLDGSGRKLLIIREERYTANATGQMGSAVFPPVLSDVHFTSDALGGKSLLSEQEN